MRNLNLENYNIMVRIKCYCRINLGLIDLSEKPHRIDGSHGMYTNLVMGQVTIQSSSMNRVVINSSYPERYHEVIERCKRIVGSKFNKFSVLVENFIGRHNGLGSGTQLSMAIVEAFNKEFNLELSLDDKAYLAGSGGTSSVGVFCFDRGGYIFDAGRLYPKEKSSRGPSENYRFHKLSTLLTRLELPKWYVCILIPKTSTIVFDELETSLFEKHLPIPDDEVNMLCKLILMGIMPAIVAHDFSSFCFSIEQSMKIGFRSREILTYGSTIKEQMQELKQAGFQGVGMSSFGPTIFGFSANKTTEKVAVDKLKKRTSSEIYLTTLRNKGADIFNY